MKPLMYLFSFLPGFCVAVTTWQGPSSITIAAWGVAGNWTAGVPTASEQIIFNTTVSITQNVPIVSGNSVKIQSSLTIANGVSLTAGDISIEGASLINNGTFTVHNITYSNLGGTVTNNQTLTAQNRNVGNSSNAGTFNNNGTLSVTMDIVVEEGTLDNNSGGPVNSAGLDVQNGATVLNGGNFTSSGTSSVVQLNVLDGGFFINESSGSLTVDFGTSNVYAIKNQGGFTNNGNITVGHTPFNPGAQGILNGSTGDFINTGSIVFRIDPAKCIVVDNHGANGSYSNTGSMTRVSGLNCGRTLPIYLSSFKGKAAKDYNELQWTFENVSALDRCILEKSEYGPGDDRWIQAVLFSNALSLKPVHNYSFKDYTAYPLSYYRLKSVDTRGEIFYSEIISIINTIVNEQVLIYPIPANQYLHLKGKIPNESSSMYILTSDGTTAKKVKYVPGSVSSSEGTLDIKELSSGVYYLMFTDTHANNSIYKFVKTN